MNRPVIPRAGAAAALLALACGAGACGDPETIDAQTRERVEARGDSVAMTLVRTLGGRLNGALAEGGPAHAIQFCAGEAQALTDSVAGTLGAGWHVKRTTTRTRNPRNAPDSMEAEALERFQAADAAGGAALDGYAQRTPAGDYRYYMPLRIGHMCLQCHGPEETLDPAVRAVLDERYPADQATGYREGELRGVVRVTVPRSALD